MYLKSLELQGFKSFPDKTLLEFGKGLTAVVGPNGSGKSNIGDAVRWVLGEQSSKTLRGGKMEDVIFGGTQLRKPVSFASVTLNISNDDRVLSVEGDIVSVTRRLWRNGDSEYMINGAQVRLKDILELFMDTGLGRDGYSIIGQGRVADIVGSKSNERREIFEEAAGISKFRYRKAESERRLASASDNIVRLRDILSELEGRVEPLRIQSEKAKKYLVLSQERKSLEISVWTYKLRELKETLSELENKLLVENSEYEHLDNEILHDEEQMSELVLKRRQCSAAAEEYREKIARLKESSAVAASDIAVFKNNVLHYEEQIRDIEEKKRELGETQNQTRERIEKKKEDIERIVSECEKNVQAATELEEKLARLIDEAEIFSRELAGTSDKLNNLYIKRSELRFAADNAKNIIRTAADDMAELDRAVSEISQRLSLTADEAKEAADAAEQAGRSILEHNNKLSGYTILYNKKSEQLSTVNSQINEAEAEIRSLDSRRQLLTELENSMDGFAGSVKSIISAGRSSRLSGIKGTVAQLISAEPKYSLAIETALGAGMQNIVVENEESAKAGIRYLKETNAGRATFLPISSVKGSTFHEKGLDMQEGYVALASELVSADDAYSGIISSLLGRIVVAENIDLATNIAKRYGYKFRIITLDGQVINAGGSFTGGSAARSTGILSRKNEIAAAQAGIKRLQSKNSILRDKQNQLTAEVGKLGFDVEGEKEAIASAESDKIRFEGECKRIELIVAQLNEKLSETERSKKLIKDRLDDADSIITRSESELGDICEQITELETTAGQADKKSKESRSEREELSNRISGIKLHTVELSKDIEAAKQYISSLEGGIANSEAASAEYVRRIKELEELIRAQNDSIDERALEAEEAKRTVQTLDIRIREELDRALEYEKQENMCRASQRTKSDRKEAVSARISGLNERLNILRRDSESMVGELWESYNLTSAEAETQAQQISDIKEADKRLNELRGKIRALGSVNTDAIDEYKEVSERYEFMSSQLEDIQRSKSELERLISELTKSMKEIFADSFKKINDNFKSIFVELFGGGKAELSLTDPDNILESGIEINVAPPGKVIKNLSLLSGGEQSFVAIAIYFAILKLRPSPFCILDEIEAALDDVNVTRYAQYLRNFTDTTQFILVTHRRGTMEEADVLYGVTMQEKGVSKLLKMDVSEVSFSDEN